MKIGYYVLLRPLTIVFKPLEISEETHPYDLTYVSGKTNRVAPPGRNPWQNPFF